jgi:predicted ribonuclease YlaK
MADPLSIEPSARPDQLRPSQALDVQSRQQSSVQTNLPVAVTSFIGREREMAMLHRALEHTRLVTLTGAGGSGNTRLALQVAAEVVSACAPAQMCTC